jgi:hypothetical protein
MNSDGELTIRLLSDDLLYEEAVRFASDKELRAAQVNGLLAFSKGEWGELEKFVNYQASRNWQELKDGQSHPTKFFYSELKKKLAWLKKQAQESRLIPDGLTKQEAKTCTDAAAAKLAQEFIQHLAAEMLYRTGGNDNAHV